jgi:signal transduction histidine kinase
MRVNLELLDESEVQAKLIEDVREMESLVAAILESERLNNRHATLSRSQCEILTLIEEVVLQHPCADRIKTSLSPVQLDVDQLRMKLLLKNLIDNACHYSSRQQQAIEISLRKDNDSVIISVRDHGDGIESAEIPRLTEAFYRSDQARRRNTGGYGLGLYLCKLIVDAHDGEMLIESEPGSGTCVVVKLPL